MSQIILASASPRRRELLEQIGLNFEVCPAKGEEIIIKKEPKEVVMELAAQKAREVASMLKTYGDEHRTLTAGYFSYRCRYHCCRRQRNLRKTKR